MVTNRSVPASTVLPHITYRNAARGSDWLAAMFGFTEHYRYGPPGAPSGAQMYPGDAWIMLDTADAGEKTPAELGYGTQSLTVFVRDLDAHYQTAKSADVVIVEDLHETAYGERQYGARDLDGHHWLFSAHARDVSPTEMGRDNNNPPPTVTSRETVADDQLPGKGYGGQPGTSPTSDVRRREEAGRRLGAGLL